MSWRRYEPVDSGGLPSSRENYASCREHMREIREQFEAEERSGCMRKATKAELESECGRQVCVAALGALEKGDNIFRVIHDATHGVKVNPRIIQRDQIRLPGVRELRKVMHLTSLQGGSRFGLSGDVQKAHRIPRTKRECQGLQVCQLGPDEFWINEVGTFGVGSAAYWWSRLAALASRGVLYLMGTNWFWQLLFADDFAWVVWGEHMLHDLVLAIVCLEAWGFPFCLEAVQGRPGGGMGQLLVRPRKLGGGP